MSTLKLCLNSDVKKRTIIASQTKFNHEMQKKHDIDHALAFFLEKTATAGLHQASGIKKMGNPG